MIWSHNATLSEYVRAELLIAAEDNKKIGVYVVPGAPAFPIRDVPLVYDKNRLRVLLSSWRCVSPD